MESDDIFHVGVKVLVFDPEGKVLLLRVNLEELTGYTGIAYWDLPGGRIRRGEKINETLNRELLEETGLEIGTKSVTFLGSVLSNIRIPMGNSDIGLVLFVFKCSWDEIPSLNLSSEHTEFCWVYPSEAIQALHIKYPAEFAELVRRNS